MAFKITTQYLISLAGKSTPVMESLVDAMNRVCPKYGIDTAQEYRHFLAQACHETDYFKTLREYASGSAYEGRKDLGNTQPGDGVKYKGRGIFQTTGRANYLQLGIKEGHRDLFINNPELLEHSYYAVWSACEFWSTRGLNDVANFSDTAKLKKKLKDSVVDVTPIEYISITINGGYNGIDKRKALYELAKRVIK